MKFFRKFGKNKIHKHSEEDTDTNITATVAAPRRPVNPYQEEVDQLREYSMIDERRLLGAEQELDKLSRDFVDASYGHRQLAGVHRGHGIAMEHIENRMADMKKRYEGYLQDYRRTEALLRTAMQKYSAYISPQHKII